jgi:hypothetical protein
MALDALHNSGNELHDSQILKQVSPGLKKDNLWQYSRSGYHVSTKDSQSRSR